MPFGEARAALERVLMEKGLVPVDKASAAEVVVFLSYGVGKPQTFRITRTSVLPEFESTSLNAVSGNPITGIRDDTPHWSKSGSHDATLHVRWLRIVAVDVGTYLTTKKLKVVWDIDVTTGGAEHDLTTLFPNMLACGAKFFGVTTEKPALERFTVWR